jgi:hypothetical protein
MEYAFDHASLAGDLLTPSQTMGVSGGTVSLIYKGFGLTRSAGIYQCPERIGVRSIVSECI